MATVYLRVFLPLHSYRGKGFCPHVNPLSDWDETYLLPSVYHIHVDYCGMK